jgi:hypothetical protein
MFASLIDAVIVVIRMKACRRRQRNNFVTQYYFVTQYSSKRELTSDRASGGLSKKFRVSVEKLPCSRRGIGAMTSRISDTGNQMGAIMTIAEYLAATALIALIVWAVLGLLMQES